MNVSEFGERMKHYRRNFIREFWDPLLSWFYPSEQRCLSCLDPVSEQAVQPLDQWFADSADLLKFTTSNLTPSESQLPILCLRCAMSLIPHEDPICTVCGRKLDLITQTPLHSLIFTCSDCRQHSHSFVRARSFSSFTGGLQDWVARYKFGRELQLEPLLAHLLCIAYWKYYRDTPVDMIVPVPLHELRLKQRTFNQSERLAAYLSSLVCAPSRSLLIRDQFTGSQTSKTRSGRMSDTNEYRVRPEGIEWLRDTSVLLVDDVYTTGATARKCTDRLLEGGASEVYILTLGR